MRIAIISFHTCPLSRLGVMDAGGMNVYILSLYKELSLLGFQIDIYTRRQGYERENIVQINQNLRVIHISGVERVAKKDLVYHVPQFWDRVKYFISQNKLTYNLIHSHYYLSALIGVLWAYDFKLPHIVTFHTTGIMKQLFGGKKEITRINLEKEIVHSVDHIIVSTSLEKKEIENFYDVSKNKIKILTPGVDHTVFKPRDKASVRKQLGIPLNRKIVVFAGRIDPIKGITVLIDALGLVRGKQKEFHTCVCTYLIGGDIEKNEFWELPEVVKIQARIKKRNIDCCVEFIGAKPHDELALWFTAADVVVSPSLYESFGLSTLEALATGTPVVASSVSGLQFLVQDKETGLLFESQNSRDLAEKLWQLLENENEQMRLGNNAYEFTKDFSWKKQAHKIADIYKQNLSSRT